VDKQIENDIANRQPPAKRIEGTSDLALMSLQQSREVRPAALEYNQFAIDHRAGRQTPEHGQFNSRFLRLLSLADDPHAPEAADAQTGVLRVHGDASVDSQSR